VTPDFLIIGGGVAGLATAWELSGRGARVMVLELGEPGRESSWAGAGILSLLLPWDYADPVTSLAHHSQALYADWIAGIRSHAGTDPEFLRSGMWVLPPFDVAKAATWQASRGQPAMPVPAAAAAALSPALAGLWLDDVAQVRNPRLVSALLEALASRGVVVSTGMAVTGFDVAQGRVTAVTSGSHRWVAGNYVVAAGAWSREMLGAHALDLPIRPVRGQMLLYRAQPDRLPCIVYEGGHYLVPRSDGHILAGSTLEEAGFDKTTTLAAQAELHAFVTRLLPDIAASGPIRHWAGLRPGSPGNVPIIGRHPQLTNLYANTGHFRYGVTLAPASARMLADLALDTPSPIDALPYRWPAEVAATACTS